MYLIILVTGAWELHWMHSPSVAWKSELDITHFNTDGRMAVALSSMTDLMMSRLGRTRKTSRHSPPEWKLSDRNTWIRYTRNQGIIMANCSVETERNNDYCYWYISSLFQPVETQRRSNKNKLTTFRECIFSHHQVY